MSKPSGIVKIMWLKKPQIMEPYNSPESHILYSRSWIHSTQEIMSATSKVLQ